MSSKGKEPMFLVTNPGGTHKEDCFYNDEPMPQNCGGGLIVSNPKYDSELTRRKGKT